MVENNFAKIAKDIGKRAVIARGLEPEAWTDEVARLYLGEKPEDYMRMLPALLLTDAHPKKLAKNSLRLLVPLRHAQERSEIGESFSNSWRGSLEARATSFFYASNKRRISSKRANKLIEVKPGAFGISINCNVLLARLRKWKVA